MPSPRTLRFIALAACAAATLFWFYTFWHIAQLPAGDGTGFQWLGEAPLTAIFAACVVPAFLLSRKDGTVAVAAGLGLLSLVLYALLWRQLLSEFAPG